MATFSEQCRNLAPGAVAAGVVAIDGKVLRRSFDRASGTSALHMVSAWGCEQRLVLAQVALSHGSAVEFGRIVEQFQ